MEFEFKGKIRIKGNWRSFCRVVNAPTENFAKEKLFGLFGSEHGLPRRFVKIESVQKVKHVEDRKE
ncbi:MAG: 50S ribosomal protein L18Ae [Candidatus Diapherotrites archaeon]|nr:50S ribosomal protein L18Ae [Candidatus Diapherotrites archaeon]